MRGLFISLYLLCFAGSAEASLSGGRMIHRGATTICSCPSGTNGHVANPTSFAPMESHSAPHTAKNGFLGRWSGLGIVDKYADSSSEMVFERTVTPPTCPAHVLISGGVCRNISKPAPFWIMGQPAFSNPLQMEDESQCESGSVVTTDTSTGNGLTSFTAATNASISTRLGLPTFSLISASFSSASAWRAFASAISILCNRTTCQVATPAINANAPAITSDATMRSSHPWSGQPNIPLTRFETVAISAIGLILIGFAVLLVAVIRDFNSRS